MRLRIHARPSLFLVHIIMGLVHDCNRKKLYWTGMALSAVIAGGFISIPLCIYFGMGS